jgi:hypothetical protein
MKSGEIKQVDNDNDHHKECPERQAHEEKKKDHEDVAKLKCIVDALTNLCKIDKICIFYVQGKCKRGADRVAVLTDGGTISDPSV